MENEIGKLEYFILNAQPFSRMVESLLKYLDWSEEFQKRATEVQAGLNTVISTSTECSRVVSCCALCRLLSRPRSKNFAAELRATVTYCTHKMKTKLYSLPRTLGNKVKEAQAAKDASAVSGHTTPKEELPQPHGGVPSGSAASGSAAHSDAEPPQKKQRKMLKLG